MNGHEPDQGGPILRRIAASQTRFQTENRKKEMLRLVHKYLISFKSKAQQIFPPPSAEERSARSCSFLNQNS